AQACVGDALQHDVRHFSGSREPCFERHETGLHEEHEERRHQHPYGVDWIDDVVHLQCRSVLAQHGGARFGTEVPSDGPHAEHHHSDTEHLPAEVRPEVFPGVSVPHTYTQGCDHEGD